MNIVINHQTILPFLTLFTTIVVNAIFTLVVLVRTYRRAYGWFFAVSMLGVIGWALGDMVLLLTRNPALLHASAEVFYIVPMIIPISIWFFALGFPENRHLSLRHIIIAAVPFMVFAALFLFDFGLFIKSIEITRGLNIPTPNTGPFTLYAAFFSVFFMLVYVTFYLKVRRSRGLARTQLAYTFYGAIFASIPALITNLSLPLLGQRSTVWIGPFFTLLFAISVTTAIIRHKLFDIRLYTVRAVTYILTVGTAALLYVGLAVLVSTHLLHTSLTTRTVLLLAFITLIVAALFQPLGKVFKRLTNRIFYQDVYDPQTFIDRLNKVLVENIELETLLEQASAVIADHLKAEFCLFGIKETEFRPRQVIGTVSKNFSEQDVASVRHITPHAANIILVTDNLPPDQGALRRLLTKNDIAVLGRLVSEADLHSEGLGYLVLGPKRSGNPYNNQDIKIIDIITKELFIAVQNALHFEQIEKFNETLQEKIDEATKKLRRTNDKLKLLDETKDDFISMASHQLRTPLTSVKGYISMVLDGDAGKLNAMQRRLLNQSFVSAQRMVYLISDLLNVSRLRTGKFLIETIPTNLADVIKGEINQLQETAESRNLKLTYKKPEHFPALMFDETKIRQVIMNFIDNAIYYTPSGGTITVSLIEKPQTIEFTVTDNGIGVPKPEQHHLFSKFYRAENAKRARPDGTGLGLFMAKKVVIAQGGAIIFKSRPDKGSTFGFSFPKAELLPKSTTVTTTDTTRKLPNTNRK